MSLAALAGCVVTARRPAPPALVPYPSPLAGPGAPVVGRSIRHAVSKGFKALAGGHPEAALAHAEHAGEGVAATVLKAQAEMAADPAAAQRLLEGIVQQAPGYAAAWLTLSVAAERSGNEKTALEAARRGASLWNAPRWRQRVANLQDRWITARLARARAAVADGAFPRAARLANAVLALDPASLDAHLLKARALLGQGNAAKAAASLAGLPDVPKVIAMRGRIAESEHRWAEAMGLYESLPAGFPGRDAMLTRAKNRWRISNLPTYVGEAIESKDVTRAQLAVLLVDLVPEVQAMAAGPVPVLPDIVGLPEQREIVAAVRAGLLDADDLEHRFFPARTVSPAEIRTAINRLYRMLGRRTPRWCTASAPSAGCIPVASPVSGRAVFQAMMPLLDSGGSR
ncbi:MAG: tetratricopeptide repeat protein [Acidobacteria bacterium]|nr:tetratricopeptide repeat protein [Acidobacteriota bacterium]